MDNFFFHLTIWFADYLKDIVRNQPVFYSVALFTLRREHGAYCSGFSRGILIVGSDWSKLLIAWLPATLHLAAQSYTRTGRLLYADKKFSVRTSFHLSHWCVLQFISFFERCCIFPHSFQALVHHFHLTPDAGAVTPAKRFLFEGKCNLSHLKGLHKQNNMWTNSWQTLKPKIHILLKRCIGIKIHVTTSK